ncbi:hypothetical protein O3P69_020134 [Scylla paramamosain]|uniref:ARID domain-containing protein n=1 Tax=Scylla paramamosain TaxID=85552 RepID=A0AAW0TLA6_SCYPA
MRVSPAPPLTAGTNPPHPPHSPHMSPAVGGPGSVVMPPHPGSGQSDGRSGNMHTPGYPPGAGPPHMPSGPPSGPHNYSSKIGHIPPGAPPGPSYGQPTYQGGHQYPAVRAQGPIMQPYPQNFPPGAPQSSQGSPSPMPPGPQYPPRPPHNNHVPPNAPYGYPPFGPQGWGAQGPPGPGMSSSMMPGAPSMAGKGGPVQMPSQVGQPGSSVSGPRPHTPPHTHYMKHIPKYSSYTGPQMYPNGPGMAGLPPGGPNSSRESPQNNMPPPTSTPQPLTPSGAPLDSADHASAPSTALSNSNPPSIGPDGNPVVDEASQQSTVSNNSAASGEDRSVTPKPHKEGPLGGPTMPSGMGSGQHPPSHPPTPINSASSPGAVSMNSQQDEFETVNSPGWPRSPSTQTVYANSQPPPPPDIYRPSKPGENLARLYEMSDSPERRAWLDKLLAFMDDNKTPITACPTISKNPLDLYALYLHVRERGGFVEVTKNKQWKDVAAVMGIGASSSGSYTLRKHYMKHILAYECKFDRGGVDPQPIINQIETAAKKKTTKTISVPSPGSSNSQDSFPPAGSNSSSLDGFTNGPHVTGAPGVPGPYPQYPPSSEYGSHLPQRQATQATAGYQGYQGGQYHGYQGMQAGYTQPGYPNSGYPPDGRGYPPPGPPNHQGSYQGSYQQPGGYQRPAYTQGQPAFQQDQYPGGYQGGSMYPPQKSGSAPSPGPPGPAGAPASFTTPRRHPDFEKTQPPGWRTNSQYPGFAGQSQAGPPQQPWSRPNDSTPPGAPAAQWSQPRFPGAQPQFPTAVSGRGWSGGSFTQNVGPRVQGPGAKQNYLVPPGSSFKCGGLYGYTGKHQFPLDSVEAVLPVLARRKRMTRTDLPTCDPWRLLMSLRCGLAAEVTWALDVLNILLFDDQTVVYFGLHHMPGLLEALIEHLRRGLINMFDICSELELGRDDEATGANKRVKAEQHDQSDRPWYLRPPPSPTLDLDLGRLEDDDPANKEEVLRGAEDFTLITKTGKSVKFVRRDGELFLREGVREWDKWEGFSSGVDTWSVGGGECTAHIICTMQSAVPPLAFTRLLPGKDGKVDLDLLLPRIKEEVKEEVKEEKMDLQEEGPVKKVKVREEAMDQDHDQDQEDKEKMEVVRVKEEPEDQPPEEMETEEEEASTTTNSTPKPPPPPPPLTKKDRVADLLAEMKEKRVVKMEDLAREKCDNSKDNKATFGSRANRVNNSGKSKLDEIFKRFSKEPQESHTSDNKKAAKETSSSNGGTAAKKDSEPLSAQPQPPSQQQPQPEQDSSSSNNSNSSSNNNISNNNSSSNNNNNSTNNNSSSSSSSSIGGTAAVVKQEQVNSEPSLAEKRPEEQAVSVLAKRPAPKERLERRESGSSRRDSGCFKRPHEDLEEESWSPDEASLSTTTEGQDWLARRVICVGTVIRNLSFIPGNEDIMSKSASLLALLGKTILLHHDHPRRTPSTAHYDRDEEADLSDWCSSLAPDTHWWWPYLHHVHENTLVTLANMAGNLDLSVYPEEISRPLLNGLLHWATCPASYGQDPFLAGGTSPQSSLSPQRLALEALVKLCVLDQNTDLVLATPPFTRLDNLCGQLTRFMCRGEDQVLREFSINLLHYFSAADSGVARVIAMQNGCVSLLVAFIEEAEAAAMNVANVQGVSALKENPELMGTSLDMVRRSANTLVHLSRVPANARVISGTENRLLTLVMSQILDTYVASQLSQVLFNVAHLQGEVSDCSPSPSPPSSPTSAQVSDASSTATLPPLPLPLPIPMSALPPVSLPVPPPIAAPVATPAPAPAAANPASAPAITNPAPTTGLTTATTTTPTSTPALTSTSAPTTTTTTTTTTPTPATAPDAPTDPKSPAADAPSNSTPASTPAATPIPATNPAPSSPTPAQAPAPTLASAPVVNHDSAAPAESEKSSNTSGSPGPEPTTTQPPSSPATTTTTTNTTTPSTLSSTTTTTIATTTTATTTTTTTPSLPTASLSLGKHSSLSPSPNPAPSLHLTSQMAPLPVKAPSAPPTQTTNSESTSKCESLAAAATVEPPAANSSS